MPKDYKNIGKNSQNPGSIIGHLLSFFTGLSIGLLVALFVYIYEKPDGLKIGSFMSKPNTEQKQTSNDDKNNSTSSLPEPKFDFYKILPNKEVNISEWIADIQNKDKVEVNEGNLYIFQVGSFTQYSAADQIKAKLALNGISADIQRVVINGQDARHRVRVGPYKDSAKIRETRKRLEENNLEFMLLKLKMEDVETGN